MRFLILVISIGLWVFFCSTAAAYPTAPEPETIFPDLSGLLLEKEPGELPDIERLEIAETFIEGNRPALANWVIGQEPAMKESPATHFLHFQIAAAFNSISEMADELSLTLDGLEKQPPEKRGYWEENLAFASHALFANLMVDEGHELIKRWQVLSGKSQFFEFEAIRWHRLSGRWESARSETESTLLSCHNVTICSKAANLAHDCSMPILARRLLLKAWQLAEGEGELLDVVALAQDINDSILGRKIVFDLAKKELSLDTLIAIQKTMPSAKGIIEEQLLTFKSQNMTDSWRWILLLWKLGYTEIAKKKIPDASYKPQGYEESIVAVAALAQVANDSTSATDKIDYRKRAETIWNAIETKELSSLQRMRLLVMAQHFQIAQTQLKINDEVKRLEENGTVFGQLGILLAFIINGNTQQPSERAEKLVNALELSGKAAVFESVIELHKQNLMHANRETVEVLAESAKGTPPTADMVVILTGMRVLWSMRKHNNLDHLVETTMTEQRSTGDLLTVISQLQEYNRARTALILLRKMPGDYPPERRYQMMQIAFLSDQHELAQKLFHESWQIQTPEQSLSSARILLAHYKNFMNKSTYSFRSRRISIDIYSQFVVNCLWRHIKNFRASSDYPEMLAIINELQTDDRLNDPSVSSSLRKSIWETREKLDGNVFEIFEWFESFGPQPIARHVDLVAELARMPENDYFQVAFDRISSQKMGANLWEKIYQSAIENPKNAQQTLDQIKDAWKDSIDPQNREFAYLALAEKLAATSSLLRQLHNNKITQIGTKKESVERLITDLENMAVSLKTGPEKELPPARRVDISITPNPRANILSAGKVAEQIIHYEWLLSGCLNRDIETTKTYDLEIEVTTDESGLIRKTQISKAPTGFSERRSCLENRLKGLTIKGIDPPFGWGKIQLSATPRPPKGWSVGEIDLSLQRIENLKADRNKLKKQLEEAINQSTSRINRLDGDIIAMFEMAREISFDENVYRQVAWWQGKYNGNTDRERTLLKEAVWFKYLQPIAIAAALLLIILLIFWRRRARKR